MFFSLLLFFMARIVFKGFLIAALVMVVLLAVQWVFENAGDYLAIGFLALAALWMLSRARKRP